MKRIVKDKTGDGVPDVETFRRIPDVDQTFGGFFSADSPAPDRSNPKCEKRDPAALGRQRGGGVVRAVTSAAATSAERAEPILRLRGIGRRFGGVIAVSDVDLTVRRR